MRGDAAAGGCDSSQKRHRRKKNRGLRKRSQEKEGVLDNVRRRGE